MDKGANKSSPQSKQTMASMQQKGGAQPHPSSSTAQQQPTYNVSSSMGWGHSMGMQNPGMGYSMMPMCPCNIWTIWNAPWHDRNRGYGMIPEMQFQRSQ